MSDRNDLSEYYKKLYEEEVSKNEKLNRSLVELEAEHAELKRKVDMMKNSLLFRIIKPFRNCWAIRVLRQLRFIVR